jgi:tripartite-type tricarboxylate transporter receptor subunit TctC
MLRASMLLAGLVLLAGAAAAQYPERPIVTIVPFPPGGVADTVARPVAEALGRELRQTLIVENKLGAGGALGIAAAARACRRLHAADERPKTGRSRPPPVGIKQSGKATFA